jgi:hypothetical protein
MFMGGRTNSIIQIGLHAFSERNTLKRYFRLWREGNRYYSRSQADQTKPDDGNQTIAATRSALPHGLASTKHRSRPSTLTQKFICKVSTETPRFDRGVLIENGIVSIPIATAALPNLVVISNHHREEELTQCSLVFLERACVGIWQTVEFLIPPSFSPTQLNTLWSKVRTSVGMPSNTFTTNVWLRAWKPPFGMKKAELSFISLGTSRPTRCTGGQLFLLG